MLTKYKSVQDIEHFDWQSMIQASKKEFVKSPISLNSTCVLVKQIRNNFEGNNYEKSLSLFPTKYFFIDINDCRKKIYKMSYQSKSKKAENFRKYVNLNVYRDKSKNFDTKLYKNELIPSILCNNKTRYYGFENPKIGELAQSKLND